MYENPYFPRNAETLAEQIKGHWRQFSPKLYRDLSHHRLLDSRALQAANEAAKYEAELRQRGLDPLEAASQAMREKALVTYD